MQWLRGFAASGQVGWRVRQEAAARYPLRPRGLAWRVHLRPFLILTGEVHPTRIPGGFGLPHPGSEEFPLSRTRSNPVCHERHGNLTYKGLRIQVTQTLACPMAKG